MPKKHKKQLSIAGYYTIAEVADIANLSENTVRCYVSRGTIKAQYVGAHPLVSRSDLTDFLSNRRSPGNPQWVATSSKKGA